MYVHSSAGSSDWISDAVFRDTSAWYHIVHIYDSANGTAEDRGQVYVNGTRVTSGAGWDTDIPVNNVPEFTESPSMFLGINGGEGSNNKVFDGLMAEVNFIDGQALTPDNFGETGIYGQWKPIEYAGTYGNNGFYLPFKQDYTVEGFSTVTYEGTGASQYIGGTGFKPDFIWGKNSDEARDHYLLDSVRGANNYLKSSTTGAAAQHTQVQTSFDNDGFTVGTSTALNRDGYDHVAWCWDMGNGLTGLPKAISATGNVQHSTAQSKLGGSSIVFDGSGDFLDMPYSADFDFAINSFTVEAWIKTSTTGTDMALVSMAYHTNSFGLSIGTDNKIRFQGNNPDGTVIGTTAVTDGAWYHIALVRDNNTLKVFVDGTLENSSAWLTSLTPTTATRLTIGEEAYTGRRVPYNGFMDEVRISNSARYTSNFTPDTSVFSNDSNTILLIHSDTTNGSTTFVDSSGAAANTSGSITTKVLANPTYGQSIVSYTGTGSAATVGHGLSSAPNMIISKKTDAAASWMVYHSSMGATKYILMSSPNAAGTSSNAWNDTDPTSTVYSVLASGGVNTSGASYIAYCFSDVTGYSKFSSYEGTGGTHTITLGFAPAFLMIKNADASGHWTMWDNARNPNNPVTKLLRANTNGAEETKTDREPSFLSTGFSIGDADADTNASGQTYIYMAFADTREYAYWYDQSGNNNDWTSNDLSESDVMVDSPTNNFCTFNSLNRGYGLGALSEGNLNIYYSTAGSALTLGTLAPNSGKWYCEFTYIHGNAASDRTAVGIGNANENVRSSGNAGKTFMATTVGTSLNRVWLTDNVESDNNFPDRPTGTIIQFAWDMDAGKAWMGTNNQWSNSSGGNISISDVVAGNNATVTDSGFSHVTPLSRLGAGDALTNTHLLNCGQDSSFGGNKTPQGYADSNDIGDFFYPPPTGFLALCTKNLPSVDVIPSENFNTVIYTGNGARQPRYFWGWLSARFSMDEKQKCWSFSCASGSVCEVEALYYFQMEQTHSKHQPQQITI